MIKEEIKHLCLTVQIDIGSCEVFYLASLMFIMSLLPPYTPWR